MGILDDWIEDMPQQFQGKERIEALISAFAKQIEELHRVFKQLDTETDLESAVGMNLDMVGDIITLTRKEAGILAGIDVEDPVISDERYRQFLKYQMLVNTNECTYYDIMESIDILWDINKVFYYEHPDRPATIFIGLPMADVEENDQAKGRPNILKPAGVGLIYAERYATSVNHVKLEKMKLTEVGVHSFFSYFTVRILDGGWMLDGSVNMNHRLICCLNLNTVIDIDVKHKESIKCSDVTVKKDLWYINGEQSLNGFRILDAEIRKEML